MKPIKESIPNHANTTEINLDHFFELSHDLLCVAGYDGYFKKVNPAVIKTLGYSLEELLSTPIREFIHVDDRERTALYRDNIKQNIPLLNFENRYITKFGETVWLSWTSMPLHEESLVYAIAKDITHKKKLEEDRNLLITQMTKMNKSLKQLTYTTSHDLRSPVHNLLSIFSLIDGAKIEDKETQQFIDILKTSTENLNATLNNYIDDLKLKDGLNVKVEPINLHTTLDAVLLSIKSLIEKANATIVCDFSHGDTVLFNKPYLESIFLNLITNSIKYARHDIRPIISISTKISNNALQLIFQDNGIGFDMDNVKDKVFKFNETFQYSSESKGIGLYLVYNHVTNLGGNISLESRLNEGATFTITFK